MPEVAHAGEDHGEAGLSSAAAMTSSSRMEPPGWITAVAPASAAASRPSANGKKASEATTEPLASGSATPAALAASCDFERGDAGAVDAAHLAGADADRGAVLGVDDGVRLDVLGDLEGELQVGQLLRRRLPLGHDLQLEVVDHGVVARLHEEAAGERAEGEPVRARIGQAAGGQQAQVLLRGEDGLGLGAWRPGAMTTSVKMPVISRAVAASIGPLSAMMPPKALTGSQRNALA